MLKSENTMFLGESESYLNRRVLDIEGVYEEFSNKDYDYINKLIREIEKNKINY